MNLKTWMRAATEKPYNFRLSLTDAPNDDLTAVMVRIKHAELRISGGGREARVLVAENRRFR